MEQTCSQWWILSALHGLVHIDDVLESYDSTLIGTSRAEKRAWSRAVLSSIDRGCMSMKVIPSSCMRGPTTGFTDLNRDFSRGAMRWKIRPRDFDLVSNSPST